MEPTTVTGCCGRNLWIDSGHRVQSEACNRHSCTGMEGREKGQEIPYKKSCNKLHDCKVSHAPINAELMQAQSSVPRHHFREVTEIWLGGSKSGSIKVCQQNQSVSAPNMCQSLQKHFFLIRTWPRDLLVVVHLDYNCDHCGWCPGYELQGKS